MERSRKDHDRMERLHQETEKKKSGIKAKRKGNFVDFTLSIVFLYL